MKIRAATPEIQAILEAACEDDLDHLASVSDADLYAARCHSGCTALHWAAGANQVVTVLYLIERGMPVDVAATKKASKRTPLHYACRNGCMEVAQCLVGHGAEIDPPAKHGVTPFQLAVWRNHLDIVQWLVQDHKVNPAQINDFACGAVHWLGIAPVDRASTMDKETTGSALLPLARWLAAQPGIDFSIRQRQGHSSLQKAAWGGHLDLVRHLHQEHDMWDDTPDHAGNYAADLADMADTPRHARLAQYLRACCSRQRAASCRILGVSTEASASDIRRAYLGKAREHHPDRRNKQQQSDVDFDAVHKAYQHLTVHGGHGSQSNPAHSLDLMLQVSGVEQPKQDDCFKARLIAVLLEYGSHGMDLSNLPKKWNQVWPETDFPAPTKSSNRKIALSDWLRREAGDVVTLEFDDKKCLRVYAKHCNQAKVLAAAATATATQAAIDPRKRQSIE